MAAPAPATTLPTTATPGGPSPVTYTGNAQPTLPPGSIVDNGSGPKVTPTPAGTVNPGDAGAYSRISDVPAVSPVLNNTQQAAEDAPLTAAADASRGAFAAVQNVNNTFDKTIQTFKSGAGANNVGAANALAAALGGTGSSTAQSRIAGASKTNQVTVDKDNAQRAAQIASILNGLNTTLATDNAAYNGPVQTDASGKVTNPGGTVTQDKNNIATAQQARAKSVLASLSTELGGMTYGQFKQADPSTYQKILQLAGGDDGELELLYEANQQPATTKSGTPVNPLSSYHFSADGHVYGPSATDPNTIVERPDLEHLTTAAQAAAAASGGTAKAAPNGYVAQKMPDGNIYLFPKDASGKATYDPTLPTFGGIPLTGANGIPAAPVKKTNTPAPSSGSVQLTKAQYSKLAGTGIDQTLADKLTTAVLKGIPLDQIRAALTADNEDPKLLDYYDNTVGIAKLLQYQKAKAAGTATGAFGG